MYSVLSINNSPLCSNRLSLKVYSRTSVEAIAATTVSEHLIGGHQKVAKFKFEGHSNVKCMPGFALECILTTGNNFSYFRKTHILYATFWSR
jgi:hypothetical protein